jgi:hypothetical protein
LKIAPLSLLDPLGFYLNRPEVHVSEADIVVGRLVQILVLRGDHRTSQNSTTLFKVIVY